MYNNVKKKDKNSINMRDATKIPKIKYSKNIHI